jgi:hypothetical protein
VSAQDMEQAARMIVNLARLWEAKGQG